ncbi:MAG: hypothetical protein LBB88_01885, partial [Planctomycetaceae bacterium]|nr:hypothetical protein [Planctomycetaceae bacterium]
SETPSLRQFRSVASEISISSAKSISLDITISINVTVHGFLNSEFGIRNSEFGIVGILNTDKTKGNISAEYFVTI